MPILLIAHPEAPGTDQVAYGTAACGAERLKVRSGPLWAVFRTQNLSSRKARKTLNARICRLSNEPYSLTISKSEVSTERRSLLRSVSTKGTFPT